MKKLTKRFVPLLLAVVLVFGALAGCNSNADNSAPPADASTQVSSGGGETSGPKTVTVATTVAWTTINPFLANGRTYYFIMRNLFGDLACFDGENNIQPWLADSWTISDDGLTYTVKLNPDAKWHDGQPFTAEDVVFSVELATNPAVPNNRSRSQNAYWVGCDDTGTATGEEPLGVTALDEHTVEFKLRMPVGENVVFTSIPYLLPKHLLENEDPAQLESWAFWDAPVGAGPWKFDSTVAGESITMTKFDDFCLGSPKFDTLIYKVFASSELLPGLISGEIDLLVGNYCGALPMVDYDLAVAEEKLTVANLDLGKYVYLPIELNFDYLQDPRVRQAFEMAIDKEYLLNTLNMGFGEVISSPFSSACKYIDPSLQSEYNPDKARQLLEDAGWDFGRVLKMAVNPEKETIYSGVPVLVQQMLGEIGVQVELVSVDYTTQMSELAEGGHYDLSVMGGGADVKRPYFLSSQYNPSVYWQWSHLKDPKFLDVFNSTLTMTDENEIAAAYQKFQRMQLEDPVYIWLFEADEVIAYNNQRLSNVTLPASGDVAWHTWEWVVS